MTAAVFALGALVVGLVCGVFAMAIIGARQREEIEAAHDLIDAAIGWEHTRRNGAGVAPIGERLRRLDEDDRRLRLAVTRYRAQRAGVGR